MSWFKLGERCPRCGLASDRVHGHFVGAVGFNTMFTFGILLVVLLGGTGLTYPDFPVVPMLIATLAVAAVVPVAFWPFSQTLWTAFDLAWRPAAPSELDAGYLAGDSNARDGFPGPGTGAEPPGTRQIGREPGERPAR